MKHIARYIPLSCRSAPNRTEHVHVGILVQDGQHRWRVHISPDLSKLQAFDPRMSPSDVQAWEREIPRMLDQIGDFAQAVLHLQAFGYAVAPDVEPGSFEYKNEKEYAWRVVDILRAQVLPPAASRDGNAVTERDVEMDAQIQTGGPAFPVVDLEQTKEGMTLRDYFAARAMQALLMGEYKGPKVLHEGWDRSLAHEAYMIADAMLNRRKH